MSVSSVQLIYTYSLGVGPKRCLHACVVAAAAYICHSLCRHQASKGSQWALKKGDGLGCRLNFHALHTVPWQVFSKTLLSDSFNWKTMPGTSGLFRCVEVPFQMAAKLDSYLEIWYDLKSGVFCIKSRERRFRYLDTYGVDTRDVHNVIDSSVEEINCYRPARSARSGCYFWSTYPRPTFKE